MLNRVILEKEHKCGDAYCTKINTKCVTENGGTEESVEFALEYSQQFFTVLNREELTALRAAINEALNA